jgi:hypothetical protein
VRDTVEVNLLIARSILNLSLPVADWDHCHVDSPGRDAHDAWIWHHILIIGNSNETKAKVKSITFGNHFVVVFFVEEDGDCIFVEDCIVSL